MAGTFYRQARPVGLTAGVFSGLGEPDEEMRGDLADLLGRDRAWLVPAWRCLQLPLDAPLAHIVSAEPSMNALRQMAMPPREAKRTAGPGSPHAVV